MSSYLPELSFSRVEDVAESLAPCLYFQRIAFEGDLCARDWLPLLRVKGPRLRFLANLRFKEEVEVEELHRFLRALRDVGSRQAVQQLEVRVQLRDVEELVAEMQAEHRAWSSKVLRMKVGLEECEGVGEVVARNDACLVGMAVDFKSNQEGMAELDAALLRNSALQEVSIRGRCG